jgi:hypothetical protein
MAPIDGTGAESVLADPDVVGTLVRSFEHVSVACVLLGSATGAPAHLAALHGTRLDMLLSRMLDTTVRGVVYEAAGTVDPDILAAGAALVRERCEDSRIPYVVLRTDPAEHRAWSTAAVAAVDRTLAGDPVGPR